MPTYRYRALSQTGEIISGSISAPTMAEVSHRMEYLGLVPIEAVTEEGKASEGRFSLKMFNRPREEEITVFTRDLALLLRAGASLDTALELLAEELGSRLRPTLTKVRASVLGGESLADALARHPTVFPAIYVTLVGVGETSGKLEQILDVLASQRERSEAVRRKLTEALSYPLFVTFAATCVLVFFLLFVLPQFAGVLRDFGAKLDPIVEFFLAFSDFVREQWDLILALVAVSCAVAWLVLRRASLRARLVSNLARLPLVRTIVSYHVVSLFCRGLGVLLSSGVTLSAALRILVQMLERPGQPSHWSEVADRVRHGGKLSAALTEVQALPALALRMLVLGEETGQLPILSERVADIYDAKLQRLLDQIVGIAGPAAIVAISIVVGGLIVSVMTSLLSVSQVVG